MKRWTFESWEGDLITSDQIKLASDVINASFFVPVAYKPNSIRQDQQSRTISGLKRVMQSDIAKEQEYQALNVAKGIGRVHVIPKLDEHVEIGFNEILVLDEVPVHLPPVAGVITSRPFNAVVAHQPAGERLGNSKRVHQERPRFAEAV